MFQPGTDIALLLAVSTWTSVVCHAASRYVAQGPGLREAGPRWSMLLLLAVGSVVWGANGLVQPIAALQVAGAAVAVIFSWDVAGVLEYYVRTRF